jgi:hypothetical protein
MTTQQELLNDIQSKLQLLSTTSTVEERIKTKIKELKNDFEESAKEYEYTDYIGHDNPTYCSFLKIYNDTGFGAEALKCLDQRYGLYYDDIESLVEMVNDFEKRFRRTLCEITELERYLEGE